MNSGNPIVRVQGVVMEPTKKAEKEPAIRLKENQVSLVSSKSSEEVSDRVLTNIDNRSSDMRLRIEQRSQSGDLKTLARAMLVVY